MVEGTKNSLTQLTSTKKQLGTKIGRPYTRTGKGFKVGALKIGTKKTLTSKEEGTRTEL